LRQLVGLLALVPAVAAADPARLSLQVDLGSEVDTNVHRTASEDATGVTAAAARVGGRLGLSWRPSRGRSLKATLLAAARGYSSGNASTENVAVLSGDLRWDARLAERPLAWGARVTYFDALEADTQGGAADHDFRTGDGSLSLTLVGDGDHRVSASAGYRLFEYKPQEAFSFQGEHAGLTWTKSFPVGGDEDPGSVDLTAGYTVHRRRYEGTAITSVCPPGMVQPTCLLSTDIGREDLFHAASAEVTYTRTRIFGLRYELMVNSSNSFGQSLLRHRIDLGATTELFADIFLNVKLVLQLNQFLDPVLLSGDVGTFITIEDETRNTLVVHATRELTRGLDLEARYSVYANAFATEERTYRRHTVYLGLVFARDLLGD
jgi:hypothetical protein